MSSILTLGGLMVLKKTTKTNVAEGYIEPSAPDSWVVTRRVEALRFPTEPLMSILVPTTSTEYTRRLYEQLVHD